MQWFANHLNPAFLANQHFKKVGNEKTLNSKLTATGFLIYQILTVLLKGEVMDAMQW